MPKPYPKEFRDDVVSVARNREPGQHLKQIAADFGISEVFSPGIHAQLKGALGVADQGFSESSATSGAGPRRRLPPGGTRRFAGSWR